MLDPFDFTNPFGNASLGSLPGAGGNTPFAWGGAYDVGNLPVYQGGGVVQDGDGFALSSLIYDLADASAKLVGPIASVVNGTSSAQPRYVPVAMPSGGGGGGISGGMVLGIAVAGLGAYLVLSK